MYKKFIILFIGLLVSQPCVTNTSLAVALNGDCSSDACDDGLYCKTDPFAGSICQRCNIPNHAYPISNGGTDSNGCRWECDTGYYQTKKDGTTYCVKCPYNSYLNESYSSESNDDDPNRNRCHLMGTKLYDGKSSAPITFVNFPYLSITARKAGEKEQITH